MSELITNRQRKRKIPSGCVIPVAIATALLVTYGLYDRIKGDIHTDQFSSTSESAYNVGSADPFGLSLLNVQAKSNQSADQNLSAIDFDSFPASVQEVTRYLDTLRVSFPQLPQFQVLEGYSLGLSGQSQDTSQEGIQFYPGELDSIPAFMQGYAHCYLEDASQQGMVAQSWFYPVGTRLLVINRQDLMGGNSPRNVEVTIVDRGPERVKPASVDLPNVVFTPVVINLGCNSSAPEIGEVTRSPHIVFRNPVVIVPLTVPKASMPRDYLNGYDGIRYLPSK